MDSTQGFHAIMSVFLLPMWLLSGAFFPMDVGGWLGWIIRINPLTYGVAGLRHYLQNEECRGAHLPSLASCWIVSLAFAGVIFAADCWIAGNANDRRFVMSSDDHQRRHFTAYRIADRWCSGARAAVRSQRCGADRDGVLAVGSGGRFSNSRSRKSEAIPAERHWPAAERIRTDRTQRQAVSLDRYARPRVGGDAIFSQPAPANACGSTPISRF